MSFPVIFADGSKRTNSTYQFPLNGTGVKTAQCELKAKTSILKPVLLLQDSYTNLALWSKYNLAYIANFGSRYYHIINWVYNGALLECYLEVDVLATYKSQLSTQSFYILRSANSSLWNNAIIDTQYPAYPGYQSHYASVQANPLQPSSLEYGVYIVGILNPDPNFGALCYYAMSYADFAVFCQGLWTLSNMGDWTGVPDGIAKSAANPFQYVASAFWLPYVKADLWNLGYVSYQTSNIEVGYGTVSLVVGGTTFYAYVLDSTVLYKRITYYITATVPKHPWQSSRGAWLNYAPYARYFFNFYPFGSVELDANAMGSTNTLYMCYTIDVLTGKAILKLGDAISGTTPADYNIDIPFRVLEGQVGVTIPLASIQTLIPSVSSKGVLNAVAGASANFGGFVPMLKAGFATGVGWLGDLVGASEATKQGAYEIIGSQPMSQRDLSNIATGAASATSYAEIMGQQEAISFYNTQKVTLAAY